MSLFILIDETSGYWWLKRGGFGPMDMPLMPMTFTSREQAEEKARILFERYGFVLTPTMIRPPGRNR